MVNQDQLSGKWSLRHDGHLHGVTSPGGSDVHGQLELPHDDTEGEEEEEAGEEDGEENKEINVKLVLTEEDVANNLVTVGLIQLGLLVNTVEEEVELGGSKIMRGFRNGDNESVPYIFYK